MTRPSAQDSPHKPAAAASPALSAAAGALLRSIGRDPRDAVPLSGEHARRRYWRVPGEPSVLVMECAQMPGAMGPFLIMGRLLAEWGIATPRVHALSPTEPVAVIEDLGDAVFGRLVDRGAKPGPLLEQAIGVLAQLAEVPASALPLGAFHGTAERLAAQACEGMVRLLGRHGEARPPEAAVRALAKAWEMVLHPIVEAGGVVIHGDFTLDNLIDRQEADDILGAVPVVIEFEEGGWGPQLYDLVSLLEDPHHDLPGIDIETVTGMIPGVDDLAPEEAQRHWTVLAALRLTQVGGRAADVGNTALLIRLWPRWQGLMVEPDLQPVLSWLNAHCGPLPLPTPHA